MLNRIGTGGLALKLVNRIIIKNNYWICSDTGIAGNAIDFLVKVKNMPFNDAIQCLRQPMPS